MIAGLLGALAGLGCLGIIVGCRARVPSLEAISSAANRPATHDVDVSRRAGPVDRLGGLVASSDGFLLVKSNQHWRTLQAPMALTGTAPEQLIGRMILAAGAGLLLPPLLWSLAAAAGRSVPLAYPLLLTVVLVPTAVAVPVVILTSEAARRRRHVRSVVGTYVDLVVLGLAGGVGVEGALVSAAEVSADWAERRIARALALARDAGDPAWEALHRLGQELGVHELMELAATLQLAGTEGTRIRQALSARAVSLRRHEQADEESAANAMTERLFLPGALLLVGFLIFIGYPAVTRILTGF